MSTRSNAFKPRRLVQALAQATLMCLVGPLAQAAVTLTGPYGLDPWDPVPLGPGDVNLPGARLFLGSGAVGSFAVTAGSLVRLSQLSLGQGLAGSGTALIDGAGSLLELHSDGNGSRLDVGNTGTGSLTVSGGATLNGRANAAACLLGNRWCGNFVGNGAGSTGTFIVTGAGSSASLLGHFSLGNVNVNNGFGEPGGVTHASLQVLNGGRLTTDGGEVGNVNAAPNSLGTEKSFAEVVVQGPGSTWAVTGGTVSGFDAQLNLGFGARSQATMAVSGGGQVLIQAPAGRGYGLRVGNGGDAALTLGGAGSSLLLQGDAGQGFLHIAENGGSGRLTVQDGATLTGGRWVQVGLNGGDGRMRVTGSGSSAAFASDTDLIVGNAATGQLEVLNGAQLTAGQLAVAQRQGSGAVSLSGLGADGAPSRIKLAGVDKARLLLGDWGHASMIISGGAVLDARGSGAACVSRYCGSAVGANAGSEALLTVTGAGSRASFLQNLELGNINVARPPFDGWTGGTPGGVTHARMEVLAGGLVEADSVSTGGWAGSPGATGGERSFASVLISGEGSMLRVSSRELEAGGASVNTSTHARASTDWQILQGGRLLIAAADGRDAGMDLTSGGGASELVLSDAGSRLDINGRTSRLVLGNTLGGTAKLTVQHGALLQQQGVENSYLHIAETGAKATLQVLSGGSVGGMSSLQVGLNGGQGQLLVDGAGSRVTLQDARSVLSAGNAAQGQMTVSGGAAVSTGRLEVGAAAGSRGTVLISGKDADAIASRVELGTDHMHRLYLGNGELTVAAGGVLDGRLNAEACSGNVWCGTMIGANAGANARFTVTGAGSRASFLGDFQVGRSWLAVPAFDGYAEGTPGGATSASLQVLDGGLLQTDRVQLGMANSSQGATGGETIQVNVAIRGAGSTWAVTGGDAWPSFSAYNSRATNTQVNMAISDGARLQMLAAPGQQVYMDLSTNGGSLNAKVSGQGAALEMAGGDLRILHLGRLAGTSTLSFEAGAQLKGPQWIYVGRQGGQGSMVFDGMGTRANLAGAEYLGVGSFDGTGSLVLRNGAQVDVHDTDRLVAYAGRGEEGGRRGTGLWSIEGAGTQLNLQNHALFSDGSGLAAVNPGIFIGDAGDGTLRIAKGGVMTVTGNAVSAAGDARTTQMHIGGGLQYEGTDGTLITRGGNGTAVVDGAGSALRVLGGDPGVYVGSGQGGIGSLQVLNQANLETTLMQVGSVGGMGSLRLDNAQIRLSGQWTSDSTGAALNVGRGIGSSGQVQLNHGARLDISNLGSAGAWLTLGGTRYDAGGTGVMTVSGGSQVRIAAAPGLAIVNVGRSGVGVLTLDGNSGLNIGDGSLYVGRLAGATGSMTVDGGSVVAAGYVGVGSTQQGDGGVGTLIVNDSSVLTAGTIEIGGKGYVGGTGTLIGNIINRGVFSPGNSPGTLTIDGSFINQSGGRLVLEVEADGHGDFVTDRLIFGAGSQLDLSGLQISFRFLSATDPNAFKASGGFDIDSFFQVLGPDGLGELDHALFDKVSYSASADAYVIRDFGFSANGGASFSATPVPEPATWGLMFAGLAVLLRRSKNVA